jgi:transcriptional regulator with XRE-family HTH domain
MAPLRGGQALKQAIHVARAKTDITSDRQLAVRSHVSYDTFMNWFGDKTIPRPFEVKKVADVLGVSYGDLLAAWEGRDLEPAPVQDAIRELVAAIHLSVEESRLARAQQDVATTELMRAIGSLARTSRDPRATPPDSEPAARAGSRRP